jgi:hypothetical protein
MEIVDRRAQRGNDSAQPRTAPKESRTYPVTLEPRKPGKPPRSGSIQERALHRLLEARRKRQGENATRARAEGGR